MELAAQWTKAVASRGSSALESGHTKSAHSRQWQVGSTYEQDCQLLPRNVSFRVSLPLKERGRAHTGAVIRSKAASLWKMMKGVFVVCFYVYAKFFAQVFFFCMHMRVHARECECVYVRRDFFPE